MDKKNGLPLKLMEGDEEGQLIQKNGVKAIVYDEGLWYDPVALMALMREDNANQESAKPETELDSFGILNNEMKAKKK